MTSTWTNGMYISSVSSEWRPDEPKGCTSLLSVYNDVHMNQRDVHFLCQFTMTSTWTKGMYISSVSSEWRSHEPNGCTSLLSVQNDVLMNQRDVHLFCQFRMTFTWTKNVEKSSYHDRDFLVILWNELSAVCSVTTYTPTPTLLPSRPPWR